MSGNLRPQTFSDLVGQERAKELLELRVKAFKKTKEASGHILLLGPAGLGKTTLAMVMAKEMGVNCHVIMGTHMEKLDDIIDIVQKIKKNDIVFIDEIHALPRNMQENLYQIMEDFVFTITLKSTAYTEKIPHFTLVGATTHTGLLSQPFLRRFQLSINLDDYTIDNLVVLLKRAAKRIYNIDIKNDVCLYIADISKRNAANAINYLHNLMEIAEATTQGNVKSSDLTVELVERLIKLQNIDPALGLNSVARRYLSVLINEKKPIGIRPLANMLNEQMETIELEEIFLTSNINYDATVGDYVYQLRGSLVKLTKSGRATTECAKQYLTYCKELQDEKGWFVGEELPQEFD